MRIERSLVAHEPGAALLPESNRAGGKVFLFLAANVWPLFSSVRTVLRHQGKPVGPYAAAGARLVGDGLLEEGPDGGSRLPRIISGPPCVSGPLRGSVPIARRVTTGGDSRAGSTGGHVRRPLPCGS